MAPRGGTRGGRDHFSWEQVRQDKHRENYLGHAVMAPQGRWQKGKDLTWYARPRGDESIPSVMAERAEVRQREDQMMRARLGLAPRPTKELGMCELEPHEKAKLLAREGEEQSSRFDVERVGGLGTMPRRQQGEDRVIHSKMAPTDRLEGTEKPPPTKDARGWQRAVAQPQPPRPPADAAGFEPAAKFGGPRPGWVFKMDERGLGYYRDIGGSLGRSQNSSGGAEATASRREDRHSKKHRRDERGSKKHKREKRSKKEKKAKREREHERGRSKRDRRHGENSSRHEQHGIHREREGSPQRSRNRERSNEWQRTSERTERPRERMADSRSRSPVRRRALSPEESRRRSRYPSEDEGRRRSSSTSSGSTSRSYSRSPPQRRHRHDSSSSGG